MGIPNLLRILKNITKKQSLNSYKGKKAGIDGYTWLHRSLYCIGEGILKNPIDITKCINYFTKKLQLLLRNEIIPIFIFDGDKLPMKINEEDKREIKRKEYEKEAENMLKMNNINGAIYKKIEAFDVTPEFAYEFMKILQNYNIEYYVAPYEADAQLAYLSSINYIDFIITEDSDLLAYGCKCVLFKLGNLKNEPIDVGEEILWDNIKNSKEIKFKNFSKDKFLSFCILCGCDYLKISGVGPKLSNEALNKFDDYNKFLGYVFNKNCIQGSIIETIKKYEKTFLTFRYQVVYCPNEKKMKYFNDINEHLYPFLDKYKNDLSFLGIVDFENIEQYVHGEINPITKKEIDENNNSFYISTNIYDISYYKKNYNNQRTEEDELFVKDDQSEDGNSTCSNNKYISQYNFCQKIGKNKGGKKQRKSEKPKNQYGIESFFLNNNNNKKDNKKNKKIKSKNITKKKNNSSIKEENNENNNQNNNNEDKDNKSNKSNNDENNVNMNFLNDYTFNIDNLNIINNISNKRNFNDLELFKNDNKPKNYSKNYQQKSGLHLSNAELNTCYNPLTQLKKETKTTKNKNSKISSSINSKQKKIYNKFSLKFKDEEEEEEDKKPDLGFLDNYNFSETNFSNVKLDFIIPFSSGDIANKNENKYFYKNKPGTYMESFHDNYSDNKKSEEYIRIEDEKDKDEEEKIIKIEEKKSEEKKDEDKDEDDEEDKPDVKDNSFNFDSYKNTIFSLDKF